MQDSKNTISLTKRSLLKAGWVAPLIVAISLPSSSFAANVSGGGHQNGQGNNRDRRGGNQNNQGEDQDD